jgi:hypothetical protein
MWNAGGGDEEQGRRERRSGEAREEGAEGQGEQGSRGVGEDGGWKMDKGKWMGSRRRLISGLISGRIPL